MTAAKPNIFIKLINKVMYYIHKIVPKSLLTRFMLIIMVPVIVSQLLLIYLFYQHHWHNLSKHISKLLVRQVKLIDLYHNDEKITELAKILKIKYQIIPEEIKISKKTHKKYLPQQLKNLRKILRSSINSRCSVGYDKDDQVFIQIPYDTYVILMSTEAKFLLNPRISLFALCIVLLTLLCLVVSLIFARNQIKSILALSKLAKNFGKVSKDFVVSGSEEVRYLGNTLIKMQKEITEYINKRTQMLAMISHDLKTPLTRMRISVALIENNNNIGKIEEDIIQMEQMINYYLDYVRTEHEEKEKKINIVEWIKQTVKNFNWDFSLKISANQSNLITIIKINSVRRVIINILDNSSRYANRVEITIYQFNKRIVIDIDDNGPGIANKDRELVFKAFYRGDRARNLDKSGSVGLGLTIAKEIVLNNYGNISLLDSNKLGGLLVRITFPLILE